MNYSSANQGLSQLEVDERVSLGQINSQDFGSSRTLATILRSNFLTLFNGVVGGAFLLLLALGFWQDALFGIAVLLNIAVGIVQEYRSKGEISCIGWKISSIESLLILSQAN